MNIMFMSLKITKHSNFKTFPVEFKKTFEVLKEIHNTFESSKGILKIEEYSRDVIR